MLRFHECLLAADFERRRERLNLTNPSNEENLQHVYYERLHRAQSTATDGPAMIGNTSINDAQHIGPEGSSRAWQQWFDTPHGSLNGSFVGAESVTWAFDMDGWSPN